MHLVPFSVFPSTDNLLVRQLIMVNNGKEYLYTVMAVNAIGDGPDLVEGTPLGPGSPRAVQGRGKGRALGEARRLILRPDPVSSRGPANAVLRLPGERRQAEVRECTHAVEAILAGRHLQMVQCSCQRIRQIGQARWPK